MRISEQQTTVWLVAAAVFSAVLFVVVDAWAEAPDAGSAIAARVAQAAGADEFEKLGTLKFTWTHGPSKRQRHFVWNIAEKSVTVTADGSTVTVPIAGPADPTNESQRDAHAAFINDSYWLLFEHHLVWDSGVSFEDLGVMPVPQHPTLGERHALRVRYGSKGGYTPGYVYVLYLGEDDLPVAWAFHKGGQAEPSLVTTREGRRNIDGVVLTTRFVRADGTELIAIEVEP
jgi:hypothetical protein